MTFEQMIECAINEGFADAAVIDTSQIIFDPSFRPYCEENLCGQYGANYSCPPVCGTPEEMKQRVLTHKKALVLQSVWSISDFTDAKAVRHAKTEHNAASIRVAKKLRAEGHNGFIVGASGCALCTPCAMIENKPCRFPDIAFSCMSAYCIYVSRLAESCRMSYDYQENQLPFFGTYIFD